MLDHADESGGAVGTAFPRGQYLVQMLTSHLGQPIGSGGCQVTQDDADFVEFRIQARDFHRPGGARQLVGSDAAVDPRVQVFPGSAGMSGIGDGGEVDPGHLGGAWHETADVPDVVAKPRGPSPSHPARMAAGSTRASASTAMPGSSALRAEKVAAVAVAVFEVVMSGSPAGVRPADHRCRWRSGELRVVAPLRTRGGSRWSGVDGRRHSGPAIVPRRIRRAGR